MGRKVKDLTGKRFGRLTMIRDTGKRTKHGEVYWQCVCDCGKHTEVPSQHLKSGRTSSCGCLQKQLATETVKTMVEYNKENVFVEKTSLNQLISKVRSNNKSGVKGVCWDKHKEKWKSYISINKKTINLGFFAKKEDAVKARKIAEEKYHEPLLEKYGITTRSK